MDQKGDQSSSCCAENPSASSTQTVFILVVDDDDDGEQGVPEIGDALEVLGDGTGDQDAESQSKALSQQIAVQSIPGVADSLVGFCVFGSEQKAIAPAAGFSGVAPPASFSRPLRVEITDAVPIEGARR